MSGLVGECAFHRYHSRFYSDIAPFLDTHQVYSNAEGVWDAMLNQTDVGDNKNKCVLPFYYSCQQLTNVSRFYVLQLLHPIGNDSSCILFTRWGRVGENGQTQKKVCLIFLVFLLFLMVCRP